MGDELSITEPPAGVGSECATLVELLRWRAFKQPDQKAYAFLTSEEEEKCLTYGELDRQARAIPVIDIAWQIFLAEHREQ